MEEIAQIIELKGDIAIVEIKKKSQCERCRACKFGKEDKMLIEVDNVLNANIGDDVLLQIEGKDILKASLIVYFIPTVSFLVTIIISQFLFSFEKSRDLLSLIIGFSFLFIYFKLISLYDKKIKKTSSYKPKMAKVTNKDINKYKNI